MLQANREARDEGMRIYIMAKFDIRQFFGEERWVYYNPDADIVYFRTLRSTHYMMSRLFETGLAIPRVEVEIPNPDYWDRPSYALTCASWKMEALSGYTAPALFNSPHPVTVSGCKGLREVFWVLEADDLNPKFEMIDVSVGIRSFEPREIACGWMSADFMKEYAEKHKWAWKHSTSTLCLHPGSSKIHQRLFLHLKSHQKESLHSPLTDIINRTGCEVALSGHGRGEGLYVLNFVGRPETVELAMNALAEVRRRYREPSPEALESDEEDSEGWWSSDYYYDDDDEEEEHYEDNDGGDEGQTVGEDDG
jgi:hypothetical protein